MYVLTINQRDAREAGDRVDDLVAGLSAFEALLPFQRSVGDEAIGVVGDASAAVGAALLALRHRRWNVGIGVGPVRAAGEDGTPGPLPADVAGAEGFGLVYARRAVERARKAGERIPLAVEGPDGEVAAEAEAVLRLVGQIVATRTEAEWAVVDLMLPGVRGQQRAVADALGITAQAVSRAVVRSHWVEEWACRPAAARLLDLVAGPTGLPAASYPYPR